MQVQQGKALTNIFPGRENRPLYGPGRMESLEDVRQTAE